MKGRPIALKLVDDGAMYASEAKIHPRETDGPLQRLRIAAVFWLLGMFYAFPWFNWDGRQMVLFDLPARKFHVFGLVFWPQDFFYLSMLLMTAAFALFFFTALAGRLWCGYACPQTVWTEVFLWIERWIEGPRNRRIKLDAAPWSREKILRKATKQAIWIVFALWTGFTFVGFFTPIRALGGDVLHLQVSGWALFWIFFYALATYGNAGFLREQVCKYMCPYARFQGAMFDRDTLIIAYDEQRGEARGARSKSVPSVLDPARLRVRSTAAVSADAGTADVDQRSLGDCVDCTICVQVCPTGIDIRGGLQFECIACGACIDACNTVMDKVGYPQGLIRYSTLNAMQGNPGRVLRPRIVIYAVILSVLIASFAWAISHRVPLIVDVLRDRNALYRVTPEGDIENAYTLKIMNKDHVAHRYIVTIDAGLALAIGAGQDQIEAAAGQVVESPLTLRANPAAAQGMHPLRIEVRSVVQPAVRYSEQASFFGPSP